MMIINCVTFNAVSKPLTDIENPYCVFHKFKIATRLAFMAKRDYRLSSFSERLVRVWD